MQAGALAQYRALQQDADFALWRTRETSLEVRRLYAAHLQGEGAPPEAALLAQLAELERDAEAKYMQLRSFLREELDRLPQDSEQAAGKR